MQTDWKIKMRSDCCTVTGKPFQEDEIFHTMLTQAKTGELIRNDLCEQAWIERNDNIRPLSFWKSKFKPLPPTQTDAVGKHDAESELRRLLDEGAHQSPKVCYLLALLLERKRVLRVKDRLKIGDNSTVVYEHADTQETFIVPEVELSLTDIESLQTEMKSSSSIFAAAASQEPIPAPTPTAPVEG